MDVDDAETVDYNNDTNWDDVLTVDYNNNNKLSDIDKDIQKVDLKKKSATIAAKILKKYWQNIKPSKEKQH